MNYKQNTMAFTFFFRDISSIEEAVQIIIPSLIGRSKVKIWDAGCAMGPEPYTLAIVLAENMGHFAFENITIYATDHDESGHFGEIISEGIYSYEDLKRMPQNIFEKYFSPTEKENFYKISDVIKNRVEFAKHDLLSFNPIRTDFNMIMCKNVLLHFEYSDRIKCLKMFHSALEKDGILLTENTQKMPDEISHIFQKIGKGSQTFIKQ